MYYKKKKEEVKPFIKCEFEGCEEEGAFKAPKKNSKQYHNFCLQHVAEYNKNWNYYRDMSEKEVYDLNDADMVGRRRTYRMGVGIDPEILKTITGHEDLLGILNKYKLDFNYAKKKIIQNNLSPELNKALSVLELEYPVNRKDISKKYKELSKKYHPDLTGGDKEKEEKFKIISVSYQLLIKSIKE